MAFYRIASAGGGEAKKGRVDQLFEEGLLKPFLTKLEMQNADGLRKLTAGSSRNTIEVGCDKTGLGRVGLMLRESGRETSSN